VAVAWTRVLTDDYFGRRHVLGFAVIVMTWCWVALAGLLVGCVAARPFLVTVDAELPEPAESS
jgi:hypothetical protein